MQVISFNLGSMGFLTNHSYRNYAEDIMGVIEGDQDLGHCSIDQEVSTQLFPWHMHGSFISNENKCWERQ